MVRDKEVCCIHGMKEIELSLLFRWLDDYELIPLPRESRQTRAQMECTQSFDIRHFQLTEPKLE